MGNARDNRPDREFHPHEMAAELIRTLRRRRNQRADRLALTTRRLRLALGRRPPAPPAAD